MTADEIRSRLIEALKAKKKNPTAVSREIGYSKDYLRDFLDGRQETLAANASVKLDKLLGLPSGHFLVTKEDSSQIETSLDRPTITLDLEEPPSQDQRLVPVSLVERVVEQLGLPIDHFRKEMRLHGLIDPLNEQLRSLGYADATRQKAIEAMIRELGED